MRVRDLLGQKGGTVITVAPGDSLTAAVDLLVKHNIGGLPVLERDGTVAGIVAERDIVRALHDHRDTLERLHVRDVMQIAPLCDVDEPVESVMRRMTARRHRHLVVRDGPGIAGVISVGDIVKHRLDQLETEAGVLRDYVAAHRASH